MKAALGYTRARLTDILISKYRALHREEIHDLNCTTKRLLTCVETNMKWAGHIVRMGDIT